MSSYVGRHAELYDLFYADKPYAAEAAFVQQCLTRFGGGSARRLLELACGTGRHALEFEKLGYDVLAVDYSPDMLEQARRRAAGAGSAVKFLLQDMRELDIPGEPFDAAACLFDSIGYVQTNEAIRRTLDGLHRALRPDGLFVFEFWHAPAMLRGHDPLRVRRWPAPQGEVLRIAETQLDAASALARVTYSIYDLRRDGTYTFLQEEQVNRYFLVPEMESLLAASGFAPLAWHAGFSADERVTGSTWHVVAIARRNAVRCGSAALGGEKDGLIATEGGCATHDMRRKDMR